MAGRQRVNVRFWPKADNSLVCSILSVERIAQDVGGMEFLLHVDWDSPLDVVVTITVFEDIAEFFQA